MPSESVQAPKTPPANPPPFGGLAGRIQILADEIKKKIEAAGAKVEIK